MTLKTTPRLSEKTKQEFPENVISQMQDALDSGKWMIRTSKDGLGYGGFKWKPTGRWTTAPDWNGKPNCGGGLHGSGPLGFGYFSKETTRFEFCLTQGNIIPISDNDGGAYSKVKVKKAKIIAVSNHLFLDGLSVGGSLDLEGTQITALPDGLSVGGYLDLRGTQITALPDGLSVGGGIIR